MNIVWDIETYPNCFLLCAEHADAPFTWSFEISTYKNDTEQLIEWIWWLKSQDAVMVGFNNTGFDYPVLHYLLQMRQLTPQQLYDKAMSIIKSEDKFAGMIYPSNRVVSQLDLYKIHHFDNKAKVTSLKAIEFNMRMENISDLPFAVGTSLTPGQIEILRDYCAHDVRATKRFYSASSEQIRFREELTKKYGRDFMNHNDTKIGSEIFQMELEKLGVQCYEYGQFGRQPRQTQRPIIRLSECIPQCIEFDNPEFKRIKDYFNTQVITETKGVFKDVVARVNGLDFVYGTGGLHASVENEHFVADDEMMILDVDVTSLYPSIAIEHGHYPEHLGEKFVTVYRDLRTQRISYKKGSAENLMLKLALNGTYGKSNDQFSIFYDPKFTMTITLSGQMMISKLADMLMGINGLKIIQVNTDGITMYLRRDARWLVDPVCEQWQQATRLQLESVEYQRMVIRDVNNYIAHKTNGEVKRKGAYEYKKEWHQDASFLVIPKVVEQVLIYDKPIRATLESWSDKMDFMGRVKVPRNSRLVIVDEHGEYQLENTQRYYVSHGGGQMVKIMPPLAKKPDEWRRFNIESGWTVCPCNNLSEAVLPINFDYYIQEIEKLCLSVL